MVTGSESAGFQFRKVHDDFGWKAKDTIEKFGLCSGAIYRTEAFVRQAQGLRIGRRDGQTIHIEHTVPSSVLGREWMDLAVETPFTSWMMRHSVCTAATHDEKRAGKGGLIREGFHGDTNALTQGHPEFGKPFMRYEPDAVVWNVFTGEEIKRDSYTFGDHVDVLTALCRESGASEDSLRKLYV